MNESTIDEAAALGSKVVAGYLRAAIAEIDSEFGTGFAANNTVLLGAFIQAIAIDREVGGVKHAIEMIG